MLKNIYKVVALFNERVLSTLREEYKVVKVVIIRNNAKIKHIKK